MATTLTSDSSGIDGIASDCTVTNVEDKSVVCVFCKSCKLDEINWGRMYGTDGIFTHYFCMLFSAALKQNGTDEQGVLGFLSPDILKEMKRCQRLKCAFCGQLGASVGCCNKRCKTTFHFPCGLENGARNKFHSTFESFCRTHAKHKPVILDGTTETCTICMCTVDISERLVKGTCCKASLFHKECIQRMALSAGYLFKCPTCNKTKQFIHEMRSLGIFVPDQDASWERDNRFQDLYIRYSHCDAAHCSSTRGRDYFDGKGPWALARCRLCGAAGVHKKCGKLSDTTDLSEWACQPCLEVEQKAQSKPKAVPERAKPSTSRGAAPSSSNQTSTAKNRKKKLVVTVPTPVTPVTSVTDIDDDKDFTLGSCRISSYCFSYFPYPRSYLRRLKTTTLPDWRDMELRVNLVRWVPEVILNNLEPTSIPSVATIDPTTSTSETKPDLTSSRRRSCRKSSSRRAREQAINRSIVEMEAEEVMEDMIRLELEKSRQESSAKVKVNGVKSKSRKRSAWSVGVIKKKPKPSLPEKLRKDQEKDSNCHEMIKDLSKLTELSDDPMKLSSVTATVEMMEIKSVPDEPELQIVSTVIPSTPTEMSNVLDNRPIQSDQTGHEVTPGVDEIPGTEKPIPEQDLTSLKKNSEFDTLPEQPNFKVIGDRVRSELSQNRENEMSPPKSRLAYFSNYADFSSHQFPRKWLYTERIKVIGEP